MVNRAVGTDVQQTAAVVLTSHDAMGVGLQMASANPEPTSPDTVPRPYTRFAGDMPHSVTFGCCDRAGTVGDRQFSASRWRAGLRPRVDECKLTRWRVVSPNVNAPDALMARGAGAISPPPKTPSNTRPEPASPVTVPPTVYVAGGAAAVDPSHRRPRTRP